MMQVLAAQDIVLGVRIIITLVCDRRGANFCEYTLQALRPMWVKAMAASPHLVRRLQLAFLEFLALLARAPLLSDSGACNPRQRP